MTDFTIDSSDLLHWARYIDSIPRRTNAALARALNTVGDGVEREIVEYIAAQTGIDPNDVRRMLAVSPAKPGNLTWELDASVAIPNSIDWSRPWAGRGTDAKRGFLLPKGEEPRLLKGPSSSTVLLCIEARAVAGAQRRTGIEHFPMITAGRGRKLGSSPIGEEAIRHDVEPCLASPHDLLLACIDCLVARGSDRQPSGANPSASTAAQWF